MQDGRENGIYFIRWDVPKDILMDRQWKLNLQISHYNN